MKKIIKTKSLYKSYIKNKDEIIVLRDVSFSLDSGKITILMGPSGSGKSTLLNILGTLDTEYNGDVWVDGYNIKDKLNLSKFRSSKIGFIFQFHHLLPEFTIYENLTIPMMIQNKLDKEHVYNLISNIGLSNRINHYPSEISGGERQRIAVVRALINKPSIILADEPTGNLDRENSQLVVNLMLDLRKKYGLSFLIATHDEKLSSIADRILNLEDGKIKERV